MGPVLCATAAFAWDELGPEGVPTGRALSPAAYFARAPGWRPAFLDTPASDLGFVARGAARVLREQRADGTALASAGMLGELGVTLDDVLDTLDLVDRTAAEDRGEVHQRLQDPAWVAAHFDLYRWTSDTDGARSRKIELAPDQIRLTKYLVYEAEGSPVRTERFDTALYALPLDEPVGPDGDPLDPAADGTLRRRFTRMDVYAGAYEAGGAAEGRARPLVWLARTDVNRALMQGSVEVRGPDGVPRVYNVHQNNGIPYDPAVKSGDAQARYWYFREVGGILGVEQIALLPHAAVAGDVWNHGLGKLVALEWEGPMGPEVHLVVLADTGGAFQPNLFQLDWLAGTFPDHEAFEAWERTMPARVRAGILVRKRAPAEGAP